jgi:GT2 family glycosyltransferase
VRPVVFRVARRGWNWLPVWLRDFLRPILFPPGGIRARLRRLLPGRRLLPIGPAATRSMRARRGARPRPFPRVQATVSVILPTLNAGPRFKRVLASIEAQTGTGAVDVVVVDSGSTDGTPELAADWGARVLRIPAEEFGHGRTRNLAAEAATGDVLLMLVQDAALIGGHALRALVAELYEAPNVAAVSAPQVPHTDADLFAAFVVDTHNAVWNEAAASAARAARGSLTPVELRAAAAIDNVCAVIRRPVWEEVRFADLQFAEDLDFGLRVLERGWSVRLSSTAAVAHSHNRDAVYQLRRSVADRLHVAPLIGDAVQRTAAFGPDAVSASACVVLEEVQAALEQAAGTGALTAHLDALRRALRQRPERRPPAGELAALKQLLAVPDREANDSVTRLLREDLRALLGWPPLLDFARAQQAVPVDTFAAFAAKLTASTIGRALGDTLRDERHRPQADSLLVSV